MSNYSTRYLYSVTDLFETNEKLKIIKNIKNNKDACSILACKLHFHLSNVARVSHNWVFKYLHSA
jgi:hypothetical protein